ncbi:putative serine threonine protein phosphatase PP2A-associated protein [Lyophyllum shimeji]|uniref:Serine threonine protein phosphatase PP2A-associated protein n=1 Tax=Lyophyllum shimeji TaxID=47721 RepID=A0A9P3PEX9_LYOSH|nr:putative serine threonine protein phosphatase PP2A-associated protein [Lyophyllum shimeji]
MSVPLPALFSRSLSNASKALNLPTIDDSTQELVRSSLTDLATLSSRIAGLSLFSPNETLDDISTTDLIYLLVPYVQSVVRGRVRTTEREERIEVLKQTQKDLRSFLSSLGNYDVVPEEERALYQRNASTVTDPVKRRELKIKQYQKGKDLRVRIEAVRKRRGQVLLSDATPTDLDLIASLLPSATNDEDELDSDMDEILREATLLLLRLSYAQSHAQLESTEQELELLSKAPPTPPPRTPPEAEDRRRNARERDDDMWRLDAPPPSLGPDGKGPLLDPSGKPLRPFTILPSNAADRARLQAGVFGPGYRLPTMSIDEYLQIERERGNIITGGGPASEAAPTSSEQLALEAEMDGTLEGERKAEEKRQKDENWARFTDENPRGAGNTMNRG